MSIDIIRLEGLLFFGRHGASRAERSLGQQLEVNIKIEADLSKARKTDKLSDTIDYDEVYKRVRMIVEGPSRNLLERLGEEIAIDILETYPAAGVSVQVRKPRLPLSGGVTDGVSVEVYKTR